MTKKTPKRIKEEDDNRVFDSLKPEQVYASLNEGVDFIQDPKIKADSENQEGPTYILGEGFGKTACARGIENFLKLVEWDSSPPFERVGTRRGQPVLKYGAAAHWYGAVMHSVLWDDNRHQFSEEVQLVEEGVRALNIDLDLVMSPYNLVLDTGRFGYEYFNDLFYWLRDALVDGGFIVRRRRRREHARRHFLSGKTYIDELFERYSRLLVLRIDLGYAAWVNGPSTAGLFQMRATELEADANAETETETSTQTQATEPEIETETKKPKEVDPRRSLTRARSDLAKFLNNRRSNGIFKHMVGHIWKLEEGETKGYHFHLMVFFDGAKVQQDAYLAKQLGEYWQHTITKGQGVYYNCNLHKSAYRKLGIGRINHGDCESRENLLLALAYMTKADQYLRVRADAARIFGKGVVKPRLSAAGRPRKAEPDEDTPKNAGDEQRPDDDDDVSEAT